MLRRNMCSIITIAIFLQLLISIVLWNNETAKVSAKSNPPLHSQDYSKQLQELEQRLRNLEPQKPVKLMDKPIGGEDIDEYDPPDTVPIPEVIAKGTQIPCEVVKRDPSYARPIYEEHWHSTYWGGRWSYVPIRIQFALHRIFPFYAIGLSSELDFQQNIGFEFPTDQNETDLDLYIVVFQTDVKSVFTKGNQLVIDGIPMRNGVEVLSIKTRHIKPSDKEKLLLVQLATGGYEMDYSYIGYVPPDFWKKQIGEAKQRKK